MFLQLTSAAVQTFLASALVLSAPIESNSVLRYVPVDSFAVAHCEDFAALRSRAERNDWYRMLSSEHGEPLLDEFAREFRSETDTDMLELLSVGRQLHGESAMFLTRQVAGFVTTPPPDRAALIAAMRAWLPESGPDALPRQLELAGARVEIVAWRDADAYGWTARKGHFAAFVDHPNVLGLFSGDDAEALAATIGASLAGTEPHAPVVRAFEAARADQPRCHGIEVFVDFTPFVADYEHELARDWAGMLPDPTGMLGLEKDFWLSIATDVNPGTRIDCSARMNIPAGTLAASLADSFGPLPAELPTQLPGGLAQLHALRFDLKHFYGRLRSALEEKHGPDSLETLDSLAGIDDEEDDGDRLADFLGQLDGTFAVFQLLNDTHDILDFEDFGLLASLVDGDRFRTALEKLVGEGAIDSLIPSATLEETDVYLTGEGDDDFGFAILPRSLLIGFRDTLARNLRAVNGVPDANMLDGSALHAAYDANLGCCSISIQDLSTLEAAATKRMGAPYRLPADEGQEVGRNPFDSLLIYTSRRTPDGFRFELHTQ